MGVINASVCLRQYDLGWFDDETCTLEPIDNPFGPKFYVTDKWLSS